MIIIVLIFFSWRIIKELKNGDYLWNVNDSIIRTKLIRLFRLSLPYLMFFGLLVIFRLNLSYRIDKEYTLKGEGDYAHYQVIYTGLALHPDIRKKYTREREYYDNTPITNNCQTKKYQDEYFDEQYFKMALRKVYCSHLDIITGYNYMKHRWFYEPNDEDGYSAAFDWISEHENYQYNTIINGKSELVDLDSGLTSFEDVKAKTEIMKGREFDMLRDFNWSGFQEITKDIVWDTITTQPMQSLNVIFVRKPMLFLYNYLSYFFFTVPFVLTILLFLYLRRYILKFSPSIEILKKYRIICMCFFIASMLPFLIAYPASFAMFPQAILLHILLYLTILININKIYVPYITAFISIGFANNLLMLRIIQ